MVRDQTIAVVTLAVSLILANVESGNGESAAAADQESPKAVETLRGELQSPDPAARGAAAAQLSQLGPAAAAATPELIALLEDPIYWSGTSDLGCTIGEEVRFTLGRIGEPAVAPLVELLKSERPAARRVAALALGSIESRQATQPLIGLLADADPTVRAAAVEALASIGDPAAFDPLLKLTASDPAGVGLESLAMALGASDRTRGIDTFIAWTKHANRSVREAAAHALVQWRDPRSIDALLVAIDDEYIHVQGSAAAGLDWIVAERGFAPAEAAFAKKNAYHGVRDHALAAMLGAKHPRMVELALEGMSDESREVRTRAIGHFREHPDERALAPLIAALVDDYNGVQIDAAEALAALGDAHAVPALVKTLSAKTPLARAHAAKALAEIGDPAAIEPLLALLHKDSDESGRAAAASALVQFDDDRADHAVITAFNSDRSTHVREAAAWSMDRIGSEAADAALLQSLETESNRSLLTAIYDSLARRHNPAVVDQLGRLAKHKRAEVRANAAQVLTMIEQQREYAARGEKAPWQ